MFFLNHLTLEEYLAGVKLAWMETGKRHKWLEDKWMDPYWREAILLCSGEMDLQNATDPEVGEGEV